MVSALSGGEPQHDRHRTHAFHPEIDPKEQPERRKYGCRVAREYMERLGYGDQPMSFSHQDIFASIITSFRFAWMKPDDRRRNEWRRSRWRAGTGTKMPFGPLGKKDKLSDLASVKKWSTVKKSTQAANILGRAAADP